MTSILPRYLPRQALILVWHQAFVVGSSESIQDSLFPEKFGSSNATGEEWMH